MNISFTLSKENFPEIENFDINELNTISKQLFIEWYNKTYSTNNQQINIDDKLELINSRLSNQITSSLSNFMGNINSNVEQLNNTTKELYGLSKSNKKGEVFENTIEDIFKTSFLDYSYVNTATIAHHADGVITGPSGLKALAEMKNYTSIVNTEQIEKLKNDMKTTGINFALMMSTSSAIQGKKNIDIEVFIYEGITYTIVYISYIFEQTHKINTGLLLLEHLYKLSLDSTIKDTSKHIHNMISDDLEQLENIINSTSQLKIKYLSMEKTFKDQLDSFYYVLRETEYSLKSTIEKIWSNIDHKFNLLLTDSDKVIETFKSMKGYSILTKLQDDVFKNNNIIIAINENSVAELYLNEQKIASFKLVAKRLDIQFINPEIKLSITDCNLDINIKFIKTIIKDIKRKT
jgi:hypothetical protein